MDYEFFMDDDGPIGRNADKIGAVLLGIEKRDGALTAAAVVEEAKSERSPLHKIIWGASNAEAAARYRLIRASDVIRYVKVILRVENKPPVTSRLFFTGTEKGTYQNVHTVMSSEELREHTLGQAAEDAETFRNRYRFLKETARIVEEIEAFKATVGKKKTAARKG